MLTHFSGVRGLMIVGAPPVGPAHMPLGFTGNPAMRVAAKEDVTDGEIDAFLHEIFGDSALSCFRDAVAHADGRFRRIVFEAARTGAGLDARKIVERNGTPLAVVNGSEDRIVKLDYFDSLAYANLWNRRCYRLEGCGHAPFWQAPDAFNVLLERFLQDVSRG